MKKVLILLLCLLSIGLFAACSTDTANTESEAEVVATADEDSTNVLVVYYSATGNTKIVADYIAEEMDANIFEIEPEEAYTEEDLDYENEESLVYKQHEEPIDEIVIPLVENTPENWSDYDVVFLGYPIWWGEAAFPVDTFVTENNFTSKTVIPFCTSNTSGIGDSATKLEELTNTGDWKEGMRFSTTPTQDEVLSWLSDLGY